MAKKIGYKSCQSNFDKGLTDFGSFLLSNYVLLYLIKHTGLDFLKN